jgi:hypothetical protein
LPSAEHLLVWPIAPPAFLIYQSESGENAGAGNIGKCIAEALRAQKTLFAPIAF